MKAIYSRSILQLFIVDSNDWPLLAEYYYLNCECHAFLLRAFVANENAHTSIKLNTSC